MSTLDPEALAEQATIERDDAELRHLATIARDHINGSVCTYDAGLCAGQVVDDVLAELTADDLHRLLHLAVAQLAVLGYGIDLDDPARELLSRLGGGR